MADVYLAFDRRRMARVAIKVLREDLAEDPDFVRRFAREAQALARLDHPNIVRFFSFEREGLTAFIVLEYMDGVTLRRLLAERGEALSLEETTAILRQIASALHYAHNEGFIHRDLKPGNVMIDRHGRALLTDFGIAKAMESATVTTIAAGTPAYMSPEQILGKPLDARTDIYSLGVMLFQMVTGRRPFTGEEPGLTGASTVARLREAHLRVPPPLPSQFDHTLPRSVDRVILRALAKSPKERWHDVGALLRAWEAAVGMRGSAGDDAFWADMTTQIPSTSTSPPPSLAKSVKGKQRWPWYVILAGVLGMILLLQGTVLLIGGWHTPSPPASMTAHKKSDTPIMTQQPSNTPVGSSVKVETSPETITPSVFPTAPAAQPSIPTANPTNVAQDLATVAPTPQPTPTPVPTSQGYAIVVAQLGAKLRAEGNFAAERLDILQLGDPVQLVQPCEFTEQAWCHVKAVIDGEEKEGWIRGDLLLKPQFSISPSSEGYPIQFSLPNSLTAWDVRFLPDDQLLLATTHQTKKTPLLFQLPNSNTQQDQLLLSKDQVIVLGFPNLTEFIPDEFTIRQAALAPNGSKFGLLQEDGTSILVWNVETREKQPKCKAGGTVLTFAFSPKGGRVACGLNGRDAILDAVNKDDRWTSTDAQSLTKLALAWRKTEKGGFSVVSGVTKAGDAYDLYRSQDSGVLSLLNQPIQADQAHVDAFSRIALDAQADWLAIGAQDAQGPQVLVAHWTEGGEGFNAPTAFLDDKTRQQLRGEIVAMAFSPDGTMIAAGTSNGDVMAARMEGFKVVNIWHVDDEVKALAFSPDNQYLAVLTENRLHIYELPSD